jgi:hypothetical protein
MPISYQYPIASDFTYELADVAGVVAVLLQQMPVSVKAAPKGRNSRGAQLTAVVGRRFTFLRRCTQTAAAHLLLSFLPL